MLSSNSYMKPVRTVYTYTCHHPFSVGCPFSTPSVRTGRAQVRANPYNRDMKQHCKKNEQRSVLYLLYGIHIIYPAQYTFQMPHIRAPPVPLIAWAQQNSYTKPQMLNDYVRITTIGNPRCSPCSPRGHNSIPSIKSQSLSEETFRMLSY